MDAVLCLDIGSGTQDVLLYLPGERALENCPKFVLPSPARKVAEIVAAQTRARRGIHLYGTNMGGGFYRAVKAHLDAGLPVSAAPEAILALGDDPSWLEGMGVVVTRQCPADHVAVHLGDYDSGFWRALLGAAGLPMPDLVLAAAQDHGFHPKGGNRKGRFTMWEQFLDPDGEDKGRVERLVYAEPPDPLTRLAALQSATGGPVADTGAVALLGALFDPDISDRADRTGITMVNVGNSHIVAFLVHQGRVWGVYEQHTGIVDGDKLWADLAAFRAGTLTNDQVFAERGHGCMTLAGCMERDGASDVDFAHTVVLGPQRALLHGRDAVFPAPGGDMMLAGCYGLVHGWRLRNADTDPFA